MLDLSPVQLLALLMFAATAALLVYGQYGSDDWPRRAAVYGAFATVVAANYFMLLSYRGNTEFWPAEEAGYASAFSSVMPLADPEPETQLDPIKDCIECPVMVPVKAGFFMLGAEAGDSAARPQERPAVRARIARRFAIGMHEITEAQYEVFRVATGRTRPTCPELSAQPVADKPMHCVSWTDARAYAAWLGGMTGQRYRLPSAAEWEYAARAGGDGTGSRGSSDAVRTNGPRRTGSGPANGFGIHDVGGNVAEHVADCWIGSLGDAPTDGQPAAAEGGCARRMVKDAAWFEPAARARASARRSIDPAREVAGVGFRVVREIESRYPGR